MYKPNADKDRVAMRDSTEWVKWVKSGWNMLVGADTEKLFLI